MRILVTRPKEDAENTAAILVARGHMPVIAPLIEIRYRNGAEISLDDAQAILATSSNGVHALARRTPRRDLPLFAVGAQTARAARDAGFASVKSADGDAQALAVATAGWANPGSGVLLHAAGADTKGDLAKILSDRGFEIRTCVLYDAVPAIDLPDSIRAALQADALDAVLLYSPRSAHIFVEIVVKAGLGGCCRTMVAVCISHATAAALAPLTFRDIRVAAGPTQEALLALLR